MLLNILLIILSVLRWSDNSDATSWNGWSLNDNNDRYQRQPFPLPIATTKTEFKQLWYTKTHSPVAMSPTIDQQYVYVATLAGMFCCLHTDDGMIIWQRNLSDIISNGRAYYSRTTPLVYQDMVILGLTDISTLRREPGDGAYYIAFDRSTGILRWQEKVSSHLASKLTSAPQIANGRLFIGISSSEEEFALNATYSCCTFQGSIIALEAITGKRLWETRLIPDNNASTTGYSGKAIHMIVVDDRLYEE